MSIEALKQALEALKHEAEIGNDDAYKKERDALRQAIAEAEKQPQRQPLTDEQISRIWGSYLSRGLEFARAIEAAHGIKEKNT